MKVRKLHKYLDHPHPQTVPQLTLDELQTLREATLSRVVDVGTYSFEIFKLLKLHPDRIDADAWLDAVFDTERSLSEILASGINALGPYKY